MKKTLLSSLFILTGLLAQAQNRGRTCGTGILPDEFEVWMQARIAEYQAQVGSSRTSGIVYTIPVVFHVVHNGTPVGTGTNISDNQVLSQLDVLNEDYRKLNSDTTFVPSYFKPAHADIEINFCMAARTPQGNPTNGIDRINRNTFGWTAPPYLDTYVNSTIKPATIWDPNQYLNIWVVGDLSNASAGPILGYATFPQGSGLSGLTSNFGTTTTDGVVLWYKACGRIGVLDPNYNKGRTATHEVGHWLGLRHIWGDDGSACSGTDYCTDTPNQGGPNFGCVGGPIISCSNGPNGDMFTNYMDYGDDDCLVMFSNDQKTRMQTVMGAATFRTNLNSSLGCTPVGLAENGLGTRFEVYPNPAKEQIEIQMGAQTHVSDLEFTIVDISGRTIYSEIQPYREDGKYSLNLKQVGAGMYILVIKNELGQDSRRIQRID